jgi:branched-subunit amino acid aminotransferase/4-amino-4-deoxychorismate lyase
VKNGQVFTPAHEVGCREGVTRSFIMKHLSVSAVEWPSEVLFAADEIFICSSMRGIVPVNQFEYNKLAPGPVTAQIQGMYEREVARQIAVA